MTITKADFLRQLEHIAEQVQKDQWLNVLGWLAELNTEALRRLSDELKERPRRP